MEEKKKNSLLNFILDFGPVIVFFLAYKYAPLSDIDINEVDLEKIIFATKVFVPVIFISLIIHWFLNKELPKMPLFSAVIILVFGGLTIFLRDETFIKMKPSIIYITFAFILGFGLIFKKSYLKFLLNSALPMKDEGWMKLTKRFCIFFLFLAFTNEIVWRNMSTDDWINFKTFGLPLGTFIFFFLQARLIQKFKI